MGLDEPIKMVHEMNEKASFFLARTHHATNQAAELRKQPHCLNYDYDLLIKYYWAVQAEHQMEYMRETKPQLHG